MGGKAKQSQRTKNNAKPSSSSRSAELLHNVKTVPFSPAAAAAIGGTVLPTLFSSVAAATVNPEIGVCIKKLNKKDPITRVKALQELNDLVRKSNVEDVVEMLPSWVHSYKMLAVDTEHKVREAAQICHGSIAAACGRQLARVLRAVLPAWLTAQYDEYAPAALHAQRALNSTFPENKLPEVIVFCKSEIMAHLMDNLIGNQEPIIDKKIESEEQKKLVRTRCAMSSLHGLQFLVQALPARAELDAWLWERLQPALAADAFWRLADHDSLQLRAAWYGAVSSCVRRFGAQFGVAHGRRCTRLLLAAGHSHPRLWGCLLHIMHHIPDWHQYLDKRDLLKKRILDVLENGGWGDARELGSMLLPLLAHLPEDMLTQEFYESFFKALFTGLDRHCVMASKSERQHWLTSIAECLRFLSIQKQPFSAEVSTAVHRTWLEKIFSRQYEGATRAHLLRASAHNMAALLNFWLKHSHERNEDKYDQLARNFWQNICATVFNEISNLDLEQAVIKKHIDGHMLFLQSLKDTAEVNKPSIKFEDETAKEEVVVPAARAAPTALDRSVADRFHHNFNETAQTICARYFEFASEKEISYVVSELLVLLKEFDSKSLYVTVARQFNVGSAYALYDQLIRGWLAGDTMRCRALMDVVYLLLQHLNDDEKTSMFASFRQFPPSVIEWAIYLSLSPAHLSRQAVREWLRSETVAATLVGATLRLRNEGDERAADLLLASVAGHKEELLLPYSTISRILVELNLALEPGSRKLAASARVAVVFANVLASAEPSAEPSAAHAHYTQLLYRLFHLNVLGTFESSEWHHAAHKHVSVTKILCERAREIIHQQVNFDCLSIEKIQHVTSLCPYLVTTDDVKTILPEVIKLTKDLFNFDKHTEVPIEFFALRIDCIDFNLNCLFEDNDMMKRVIEESSNDNPEELTESDILVYVNKLLFRLEYLKNMFGHRVHIGGVQVVWCDDLLQNDYFEQEFLTCLHEMAVLKPLYNRYGFWRHYEIIENSYSYGVTLIDQIIEMTSTNGRDKILNALGELSAKKGYYWAYARRFYEKKVKEKQEDGGSEREDVLFEDIITGNGFYHTLQANASSSSDVHLRLRSAYAVMCRSVCALVGGAAASASGDRGAELARAAAAGDAAAVLDAHFGDPLAPILIYCKDMSSASWQQMVCNAAILEYLSALIDSGDSIPAERWDFINITLCSLLSSVNLSMHAHTRTRVSMVCRATLRLLARACAAPRGPAADAEWCDVFAPDLHPTLLHTLLQVLECSGCLCASYSGACVVSVLTESVGRLDWAFVGGAPAERAGLVERAARGAVALLRRHEHHAPLRLAYAVLLHAAPLLVLRDQEKLSECAEDGDDEVSETDEAEDTEEAEKADDVGGAVGARCELSAALYGDALQQLLELLDAALSDYDVGVDVCEMRPWSDSWLVGAATLLLALALLDLEQLARPRLRELYVHLFHNTNYIEGILSAAFRLLPADVVAAAEAEPTRAPPAEYGALFEQPPALRNVPPRSGEIGALACRAVFSCLRGGGALAARAWWGALGAAAARRVRRVTELFVAPPLARHQMQLLHQQKHKMPDVTITIHSSSLEAECVLNVESRQLPLVLRLSAAHPLVPVTAAGCPAPGPDAAWVGARLARGGSLAAALRAWRGVLLRRVAAAAPCCVCYCRLHARTGKLPLNACRHCHNNYHSDCLRKWFATSNKSTCPICRGIF